MMQTHQDCPKCGHRGCLTQWDDGHYCHSCGDKGRSQAPNPSPTRKESTMSSGAPLLTELDYAPLSARAISMETCRKYKYAVSRVGGEPVQVAPYYDTSGRMVGQKVRPKDKSGMRFRGENPGTFFGQNLWARPNPKLRLTITEGEIDALSVYEAQGGDYPCVSLPTGAQSARTVAATQLEWLSGWKEVVLAFDMDEPGREAAEQVAMLLPPGKAFIANLPMKDPNDMLVAGLKTELRNALWKAGPFRPDGVKSASDLWEEVSAPTPPSFANYPWGFLDGALGGMRRGELVMFTAGSGVGKSTATREIAHSLGQKGITVGMLCLEESAKQTIQYQIGIELNTHIHLGHDHVKPEDFRGAFEKVTENLILWDHWGSTDVDRIESVISHMALAEGAQVIVLDHVSMVISGNESSNERKDLDILMTRLRGLCERLGVLIIGVSHIKRLPEDRKEIRLTDLRGSASLEQLSDAVISFERGDENTTTVRCLKNRHLGWNLGVIGKVSYDSTKGRLEEVPYEMIEEGDDDKFEF